MKYFAASALMAASAYAEAMSHAAIIVAGSTGFYNYRHQSDAAHAYQVMIKQGIPAENIILMMYDDVASSYYNPFPGELFNHPDGDNVYDQSAISYSGSDVTKANFLAAMKNDATTATGPVLNTDENSKIFINFVDHGAPGFICFPFEYLYADELQEAIDYMQENKLYKEMLIYIEACESGSMFPDLTADQGVFALTASNADESSWASYCPPDDYVNGTSIGSCLGDLFSTNWMEDSESHNSDTEYIAIQHYRVKQETDLSPVCQFGDSDIQREVVSEFQGDGSQVENFPMVNMINAEVPPPMKPATSRWDSRDVKYLWLSNQIDMRDESDMLVPELMRDFIQEEKHREKEAEMFDLLFGEVENMVT